MQVYILDSLFMANTTRYTGEEIIVYPVEINELEWQKLRELGIKYTTEPNEVYNWIKEQPRDYGGCMIEKIPCKYAVGINFDWNNIKNAVAKRETVAKTDDGAAVAKTDDERMEK